MGVMKFGERWKDLGNGKDFLFGVMKFGERWKTFGNGEDFLFCDDLTM